VFPGIDQSSSGGPGGDGGGSGDGSSGQDGGDAGAGGRGSGGAVAAQGTAQILTSTFSLTSVTGGNGGIGGSGGSGGPGGQGLHGGAGGYGHDGGKGGDAGNGGDGGTGARGGDAGDAVGGAIDATSGSVGAANLTFESDVATAGIKGGAGGAGLAGPAGQPGPGGLANYGSGVAAPAGMDGTSGKIGVAGRSGKSAQATGQNLAGTTAVLQPLRLETGTVPKAKYATSFSFTATTKDGTGPFVWEAFGLPPGLGIDPSTGQITGKPQGSGKFPVSLVASDSTKSSARMGILTFSIAVQPATPVVGYGGPTKIASGKEATLSGTLKAGSGTGISGRILTFQLGSGSHSQSCITPPTSANGSAHCTLSKVTTAKGKQTVTVKFSGDPSGFGDDYGPASVNKQVTVT
jgi:hypothetical protein